MENSTSTNLKSWLSKLGEGSAKERVQMLSSADDQELWSLFRQGCREALVVLFQRHHREIVVRVYHKKLDTGPVRLADVQDAFGDFVEKILAGKYDEVELKKDFAAFAVHHLFYLLKDRLKTAIRRESIRKERLERLVKSDNAHLRMEHDFDFNKVINLIPKIGNRVYRMVLYLIFIEGYNSQDLSGVFGKPSLAYDKRSRAMKAFRNLLLKEGILEELQ
jgi:DNA-directed RNA polymerase specialized sigma24 family protein